MVMNQAALLGMSTLILLFYICSVKWALQIFTEILILHQNNWGSLGSPGVYIGSNYVGNSYVGLCKVFFVKCYHRYHTWQI